MGQAHRMAGTTARQRAGRAGNSWAPRGQVISHGTCYNLDSAFCAMPLAVCFDAGTVAPRTFRVEMNNLTPRGADEGRFRRRRASHYDVARR